MVGCGWGCTCEEQTVRDTSRTTTDIKFYHSYLFCDAVVRYTWITPSIDENIRRVNEQLESGRRTLRDLAQGGPVQNYDIPNVEAGSTLTDSLPPMVHDK